MSERKEVQNGSHPNLITPLGKGNSLARGLASAIFTLLTLTACSPSPEQAAFGSGHVGPSANLYADKDSAPHAFTNTNRNPGADGHTRANPDRESCANPNGQPLDALSDSEYDTLMNVAFTFFQDGLYEEEAYLLTEMLSFSMTPEQRAEVYALRSDVYKALGNFDAELDDLLKSVEANGGNAVTFNNLCWSYALTESPELALPYCVKAVEADPSPTHLDSRGVVYAMLGDEEAALEDFKIVVSDLEGSTSPNDEAMRADRQKWVEALEAGENPITAETLEKLRKETSPLAGQPTTTPAPKVEHTYPAFKASMEEAGFEFGEEIHAPGENKSTLGPGLSRTCIETMGLGSNQLVWR
jgi:tetratricopeptide (TPR) repeat protein